MSFMNNNSAKANEGGNKWRSLSFRTLLTVVISCLALGVTALIIGLGLYRSALNSQYIRHAFDIAVFAHQSATRGSADTVGLAGDVMRIYRSLSPEQRSKVGTEEYLAYFSEVNTGKGSAYDILMHMLDTFIKSGEVDDVYLAMYDRETNALVYMVDPQEKNRFMTGEWETVEAEETERFLSWNGKGLLYHNSVTEKYGWLCTAGMPVRDQRGEVCGFILVDLTTTPIRNELISFALRMTLALLLVTALISLLLVIFMRRTIVAPVNALAGAAAAYVQDKKDGSAASDHFTSLDIRSSTEIENLCHTMADMEHDLAEHEEIVKKAAAEKERILTELNLATQIQEDALPHVFPPFPNRTEFSLYAAMDPAREVGGDFYDFFLVDEDRLAIVIADVSGKGVPAALFMMVSKAILENNAMTGKSPGEVLASVNETICANNQTQMFVTAWLGILEISTGRVTAANAGHEYPAVCKAGGRFELIKNRHGLVIGGMEGIRYTEFEMFLRSGDKLFLYTDGVPEATNGSHELFGMKRMLSALNSHANGSPQDILKGVRECVDSFVGGAEQFDDLTMLCLEYKGPANSAQ